MAAAIFGTRGDSLSALDVPLNVSVDQARDGAALREQNHAIVALLKLRPRTSVELSHVALKYTSRISELRQAGYVIKAERAEGRTFRYTLVSEPDGGNDNQRQAAAAQAGEADDEVGAASLLGAGGEAGVRRDGADEHIATESTEGAFAAPRESGGDSGPSDRRRDIAGLRAYEEFLARKFTHVAPTGFDADISTSYLFPFQRDLVRWALKRGRAAIFASTGLGKTRQELEYARHVVGYTGGRVLLLAPLAVAPQTVREGASIGIDVTLCREAGDVRDGINITNYDRLHKFDASKFVGVVLDESSCIKHWETKTLAHLLDAFAETPFKLCASATPAPNDFAELGTHAEFLNVRSRAEMLAEFFVHDSSDTSSWRLKGHARASFWEWVASWAALVRLPSDIGGDDTGYILPSLTVRHHILPTEQAETFAAGVLFPEMAHGLSAQRAAKRASLDRRIAAVADLVRGNDDQWICWAELNAEQNALAKALGDECVSIYGSLDVNEKEHRWELFRSGMRRILISKIAIFGYGINAQFCNRMAFIGASNSYEDWHQAIRRIWRFGQTRPVEVHVVLAEAERAILDNLKRKEADAVRMGEELSAATREAVRANVRGRTNRHHEYVSVNPTWPEWLR